MTLDKLNFILIPFWILTISLSIFAGFTGTLMWYNILVILSNPYCLYRGLRYGWNRFIK